MYEQPTIGHSAYPSLVRTLSDFFRLYNIRLLFGGLNAAENG